MWPDYRIQNLFGIELPIIQAPMADVAFSEMAIGVSEAGGLGSLACALLTTDQIIEQVNIIRQQTSHPINLNFFCHQPPKADAEREAAWGRVLERYFIELGLDPTVGPSVSGRAAFDSAMCDLVAELRPNVVSFHFGLPEKTLVARVRATGAKILSTATTVREAQWLESEGCDAIVAQGFEAGGHRGMFLTGDISTQIGTLSLVPQVVDSVKVPVIAAGGIADARGITAAFALGAAAVQIGTA
jgi:nitronate monooxygenase